MHFSQQNDVATALCRRAVMRPGRAGRLQRRAI